jgi:hypothetical protein
VQLGSAAIGGSGNQRSARLLGALGEIAKAAARRGATDA